MPPGHVKTDAQTLPFLVHKVKASKQSRSHDQSLSLTICIYHQKLVHKLRIKPSPFCPPTPPQTGTYFSLCSNSQKPFSVIICDYVLGLPRRLSSEEPAWRCRRQEFRRFQARGPGPGAGTSDPLRRGLRLQTPCLHSLPARTGPPKSRLRAGCPSDTVCVCFPILHPRPAPLLFSAWGPGPGWAWSALHLALVARLNSMADFRVGSPLCTARPASPLRAPHPGFLHSRPPPPASPHEVRAQNTVRAPGCPARRPPLASAAQGARLCGPPPPPPPPRSPATPTRVPGDRADRLGTGDRSQHNVCSV